MAGLGFKTNHLAFNDLFSTEEWAQEMVVQPV
jgi:hypothetical protein